MPGGEAMNIAALTRLSLQGNLGGGSTRLCLERASSHINGASGERCSRAAQLPLLPLLLAHVCALALTLSVLSHSYARLSFRRLARWLIARSTVVERRITNSLYYDDVEIVNPLGQFL